MVSIHDVAARAGVSVATVSRALRGLPNVRPQTRLKVEQAAKDLDYVVDPAAARLAGRRTQTIGVVLPALGTWYGSMMMAAMHAVASVAGFELLALVVADVRGRDEFVRDLPFRKRVDGLVVVDVPMGDEALERLAGTGVPVVATGARAGAVSSVGIDDRGAAREVVELLFDLGHTDIAVIDGTATEPLVFPAGTSRVQGVADAYDRADVDTAPTVVQAGSWRAAGGAAAMVELLDADQPPTAVFAVGDEMAIGALGLLRSRGIEVPGGVAVAGFDDHELSAHVGLTTVHQPVDRIGARAAERLIERITEQDLPVRHDLLPTRLVVRESTGHPDGVDALDLDRTTGRTALDDSHAVTPVAASTTTTPTTTTAGDPSGRVAVES